MGESGGEGLAISRTWPRVAAFFALAMLVRLPAVLENVVLRDDWMHQPAGHLQSYRPLLFADLWLWTHLAGPHYLQTVLPKLLGCLYVAIVAVMLARLAERCGAGAMAALAIAAAYVVNPINNELAIFNVVAATNLALIFVLAGDALSRRSVIAGAALIALGISGYQVYAFVPLVVIGAEWTLRRIASREAIKRLLALAIAFALYAGYVVFSNTVLHIRAWGGRGVASGAQFLTRTWLIDKYHGVTTAIGDVFMPSIGYCLSVPLAFRLWKWIPVAIAILTAVVLVRRRSAAILPLALPPIACGFLLVLNVTPLGWRVDAAPLFAVCVSLVPLFIGLRGRRTEIVAVALVLLWSAMSAITSYADARVRVAAQHLDARIATEIAAAHPTRVTLADAAPARPPLPWRGLIAAYQPVVPATYSNLLALWSFPRAYLDARGIALAPGAPAACTRPPAEPYYTVTVSGRDVTLCRNPM